MRRVPLLFLLTVFLSAAPARAQLSPDDRKIDPALRVAVERAGREGGRVLLRLIVGTKDAELTRGAIAGLGGTVSTAAGAFVIARVPPDAVCVLASRPEVRSLHLSRPVHPALDASRPDIRAELVQAGAGLPRPFTGRGVVVGIVDTGVDPSLPDFKDASGRSRILFYWDQSRAGKPPAGFSEGWECTNSDIDAGACPLTDPASSTGHGTHVAGIAAGNGLGRPGALYRGIAPEADIVVVDGYSDEAGVVDACRYVFEKAAAAGRPAVVNLSSGHHDGSHDGQSSFEKALAALLGPGRLLVAAAGNDGRRPVHVGYAAEGSDYASGTSTDVQIAAGAPSAAAYLVSAGPDIAIGVKASVTTGGQRLACDEIGPVRPGERAAARMLRCGTADVGTVEIDATAPTGEGLPAFSVFVSNGGNGAIDLSKSNWELYAYGNARIDGWMAEGGLFGTAGGGRFRPGDSAMSVLIPASAPEMVAAGAYTTKLGWTDPDGVPRTYRDLPSTPRLCPSADAAPGAAACFTSRGPTRDGRPKPDLAAPGQVIVAPLATTVDLANPVLRLLAVQGGGYRAFQGTSMASPHVAGTVALMLEASPALTPAAALRMLSQTARTDDFTGATPGDVWGAGKVDALAAVRSASSPVTRWIPIVLDAPGVGGSRFTTELTLANRGTADAAAQLFYTPASALGASGAGSAGVALGAGRQVILPDVLAYLRSRGVPIPADGSGQGGTLRVVFSGLSSPDAGYVGARTTTPSGPGRAGLSYAGVAPEEGFTSSAWVHGLREDAADRSNLALVNLGGSQITLRVTLVAGGAATTLSSDVVLGPGQWTQLARVLALVGLSSGSARVDLVSGGGPFTAYGVFNDNVTNDGSYVAPERGAVGAEPLTLPVLVETPVFSSELVLRNGSEASASVKLSYVESLAPSGGAGMVTENLGPLEERIIPDAIEYLRRKGVPLSPRGSASFAGALQATFLVNGNPASGFAGARTTAPATGGGAYGLFYEALPPSAASPDEAWIFGLQENASVRSNVAVVNAGPSAATFQIEVGNGDAGTLAGRTDRFTLPPGGWTQFSGLLPRFGATNGYAHVVKVAGSGFFLAYGVVNDGATPSSGATNDGSYVGFVK